MKLTHELDRWLYRGGRPNPIAQVLNRLTATLAGAGLARGRLVELEVTGRRTGRSITFPLVPAEVDGERYLVSMLGEDAGWVKNVRAADGRATLREGRRVPVVLEEVEPQRRAPILQRYVEVAPGARPHIPVAPGSPLEEFEGIAADLPVFHVRELGPDGNDARSR